MEDFNQILTPDTDNLVNEKLSKSNVEFEYEHEIGLKRRLQDPYEK